MTTLDEALEPYTATVPPATQDLASSRSAPNIRHPTWCVSDMDAPRVHEGWT
jgi:hypothetical protein